MTKNKTASADTPALSHLNQQGEANMVDVTEKAMTSRTATAQGFIKMNRATFELITTGKNKKRLKNLDMHLKGPLPNKS